MTEPPIIPFPTSPYCQVRARVASIWADGPDDGTHPDWRPAAGEKVTLTPSIGSQLLTYDVGGSDPIIVTVERVDCVVGSDGFLTKSDGRPVYIAPTDDPLLSATGWTWTATIKGKSVVFAAPTGGVVDLALFVAVPVTDSTKAWVEHIPELVDVVSSAGTTAVDAAAVAVAARDTATGAASTATGAASTATAARDATLAASTIVGAGRPDIPETLTTPGTAALVAAAASGTVFRSTDGSQGAWEWIKIGPFWRVTYGDTGWSPTLPGTPPLEAIAGVPAVRFDEPTRFEYPETWEHGTLVVAGLTLSSDDVQRLLNVRDDDGWAIRRQSPSGSMVWDINTPTWDGPASYGALEAGQVQGAWMTDPGMLGSGQRVGFGFNPNNLANPWVGPIRAVAYDRALTDEQAMAVAQWLTARLASPAVGHAEELIDQRATPIVGAGRPDILATLTFETLARVLIAPSGTVFRSIDGPQGAWEWQKRGSDWVVTQGDTGWVEIGDSGLPGEAQSNPSIVRREGSVVWIVLARSAATVPATSGTIWDVPLGFGVGRRAQIPGASVSASRQFRAMTSPSGATTYLQSITSFSSEALNAVFSYPSVDPWPTTLTV